MVGVSVGVKVGVKVGVGVSVGRGVWVGGSVANADLDVIVACTSPFLATAQAALLSNIELAHKIRSPG